MNYLEDKKLVIWLFIIAAIVLLSPLMVRMSDDNPFVAGGETYYNLRMAEEIQENGILEKDVMQSRDYSFNLLHYVLAGMGSFIDLGLLAKILPIILGMLFFWLGYKLLQQFALKNQELFLAMLFVIFTPTFFLVFTTLTTFSFVLVLNLLGLYLLRSRNVYLQFLSILVFALIPMFDFFAFILTFMLLLVYILVYKKKAGMIISAFVLSLVFIWIGLSTLSYKITYFNFITDSFALRFFLTDFGAAIGYSFFMFLLALIGFSFAWKKKQSVLVGLISVALFIFSFFNASMRIYLSFVMVLVATYSFDNLINREWSLKFLKRITLLLIICSLIFSAVSFMNRQYEEDPNQEIVDSLQALRGSMQKGTVLTHQSNGFYVEYFSEMPVVLDGLSSQQPGYIQLYTGTQELFATRDLDTAEAHLQRFKIRYILIDDAMKKGLVWRRPQEGLLFLIENSEKFIKVYSENGIEIYKYRGEEMGQ
ncbi:MAG: hypothetical protein ABIE94_03085 [archaeon]